MIFEKENWTSRRQTWVSMDALSFTKHRLQNINIQIQANSSLPLNPPLLFPSPPSPTHHHQSHPPPSLQPSQLNHTGEPPHPRQHWRLHHPTPPPNPAKCVSEPQSRPHHKHHQTPKQTKNSQTATPLEFLLENYGGMDLRHGERNWGGGSEGKSLGIWN